MSSYKVDLKEQLKCPGCNYKTDELWMLAETAQQALEVLYEGHAHCDECHDDILMPPVQNLADIIDEVTLDEAVERWKRKNNQE